MGYNYKKVTGSVVTLLLLFVWHSVVYSQQVSKTVNYNAIFQPFGEGISKEYLLPAEVDPEKHFQIRVNFDLVPEDVMAQVTGTLIFDQEAGTLQIRGREGKLQSEGGLRLQGVIDIAFELEIVPIFTLTNPILITATIILDQVIELPSIPIDARVPIPGFPQIDKTWHTPQQFESLLLNGKSVEVKGGVRDVARVELQAEHIVEAIIGAVTKSVGVPLPPIALDALGDAFEIGLGNAAISYNLGFLSTLTLTGKSIIVNGQPITSEIQTIKAPGLDLSQSSYTVNSSYEEQFTYQLDYVVTSDVWLEFNPLGIPVWDYPKTVIAEFPTPIIPKRDVDLNFSSAQTTFPIVQAQRDEPPVTVGTIPAQSLTMDRTPPPLDASVYFRNPDDGLLTYDAWSNPKGIVSVKRIGSQITITPIREGSTTVIVRARDPEGLEAFQRISVTVSARQQIPPSQAFERGDSVIVQNTAPIALNIRGGPGLGWRQKGQAFDGATGTITDGPHQANGYTWWKIRWDVSNNVVWTNRPAGNQGWSVEASLEDGVSLIAPLSQFPDLVVAISVSKTTLAPGEGFRLDTTVGNRGNARSNRTTLRFYRSSDPNISRNDAQLHEQLVHPINVGQQITPWRLFTAPDVPGIYYYGVCVDTVAHERVIDNNCSEAIKITVPQPTVPDLVVESLSPSLSTLTPGERFTLTATVRNIGTARSQSGFLLYYDERGEAGNRKIGLVSPNQTTDVSIQLVAPREPGVYYYEACVSNVRDEVNKNNDCSTRIPITVRVPVNQVPVVSDPIPEPPIANRAPVTVGVMPDQTLSTNGSAVRLNLSDYFWDADGDTLTYRTTSDNPNVAFLQVVGASVSILPLSTIGRANVTVTASDGSATAIQRFAVTIRAVQGQNQAPRTVGTIPPQPLEVGTAAAGHISDAFTDPDGDSLTYTARSDDTRVVTASMSGDFLTLTPVRAGSATVTVTASDGSLTATQRFTVQVQSGQSPQPVNRPPASIGTIAPQTLTVNDAVRRVNVSSYFRDSDGDRLTYTARSDNTNVATVSVSGSEVTITPQRAGNTTLHVTASDGTLTATQRFRVIIQAQRPINQSPVAIGTIAPQTLTVNDAVRRVNVSSYFRDSDGDRLTYTALSDNPNVATVSVSGSEVTITPQRAGNTTLHVTASDGILSAVQSIAVTVASAPPVQDPASFDLAIQSVKVSKDPLVPGESFTLSITIHNKGPGTSEAPFLSYYYSLIQGRTPEDQIHREGTVQLASLASGANMTKSFALTAPSTPKTYYYGAWLSGITNDTNLYNDVATEVGVTVRAVQTPGVPDLVVESVRVSDATVAPRERFTFSATVRNRGTGEASRTTLRYYRSSDATISTHDTEVDTDSVTSLDPNETAEENDSLRAPDRAGVYYYGVCVDSVTDESNTRNNCSRAIKITVQAADPDLVVESPRVSDTTVEVGERFTFYATVRNRGNREARRTTLRYYRSSDATISERDTAEDTDSVSSLDANETSNERVTLTAPNRSGVYYYGACVDSVRDESDTRNNCSTGVRVTVSDAIIVRPPPAGLRVGDSIVVQNASGGGLNGLIVRNGAGTGFKWIISVFNGATGTITDGPRSANGYTWWRVSWNRSNQVFCDVNPCVGWVFESFRGTKVIAKDVAAAPTLSTLIPAETTLLSNYPNPFNPETWIPYQLSASADVSISIYSVNGHLVRRLDVGYQSAGVYQNRSRAAYWDGRNAFGERVASGLYFYTFTAGDFTATRKMLIRK